MIPSNKPDTGVAGDRVEGPRAYSILVVDDEPGIRDFLRRALEKEYGLIEVAGSAEEAEALRAGCHFDLIISDICLPGRSGVEWLKGVAGELLSDLIFMTAYADLDKAVDALRLGAADFILKPFRLEQMLSAVRRCIERRQLARENFVLRRQVESLGAPGGMVGNSPAMEALQALVGRVAATPSVVLIEGESGTGKELVANALHRQSGRSGSFVPVNCGAIAPELLESELFGHLRGAFTGAHQDREGLFSYADGGTLFLDEIGEMPLLMQAKLLRVLEERRVRRVGCDREMPVNVRVVAATNRSLQEEVDQGRFRADLYYRLNVLTIEVPALRDRAMDIPLLAHHFSQQLSRSLGLPELPLTHADLQLLQRHSWPGNVRELKNLVERCLLLGRLPSELWQEGAVNLEPGGTAGYPDSWPLAEVEKAHILQVLEINGGNKTQAANQLGVSRKTLDRKLQAWQQGGA